MSDGESSGAIGREHKAAVATKWQVGRLGCNFPWWAGAAKYSRGNS